MKIKGHSSSHCFHLAGLPIFANRYKLYLFPAVMSFAHLLLLCKHINSRCQQWLRLSQLSGMHTNRAQAQQPVACQRVRGPKEALRYLQGSGCMLGCRLVLVTKQQQQCCLVLELTELRPAATTAAQKLID